MLDKQEQVKALTEKEAALFADFHPIPNNERREQLYQKWLAVRAELARLENQH